RRQRCAGGPADQQPSDRSSDSIPQTPAAPITIKRELTASSPHGSIYEQFAENTISFPPICDAQTKSAENEAFPKGQNRSGARIFEPSLKHFHPSVSSCLPAEA